MAKFMVFAFLLAVLVCKIHASPAPNVRRLLSVESAGFITVTADGEVHARPTPGSGSSKQTLICAHAQNNSDLKYTICLLSR